MATAVESNYQPFGLESSEEDDEVDGLAILCEVMERDELRRTQNCWIPDWEETMTDVNFRDRIIIPKDEGHLDVKRVKISPKGISIQLQSPSKQQPSSFNRSGLEGKINSKLCTPNLNDWERKFLRNIRDNWIGQPFTAKQKQILTIIMKK